MWKHENRRYFQWDIQNPFIPSQEMEAIFYHGYPTATLWKASLQPMDTGANYWKYSFFLEFAEHTEIKADNVVVFINLNDDYITDENKEDYLFCIGNRFRFPFVGTVVMHPRKEPYHFIIRIEIKLPGGYTGKEVGNGLFFHGQDLKWLSVDMRQLLDIPQYTDMTLVSRDRTKFIEAHSYIVDERWNNFFSEHSVDANSPGEVQTDISCDLLKDILTYMYSGQLPINWPDWTNADYITELFQVIYRYKLHHLYKVFLKNDLLQKRVTTNSVLVYSSRFPLDIVHGRPVNRDSRTWHVNPDNEYELIFQIRVGNEAGNWLSYSLLSRSSKRVYARVNLEVVKSVEGNAFRRVASFHGRHCTIDPDATVESGPILFLGCPETFGDSDGTESKYSIRCYLNVANGTTVERVQSEADGTLEDESERFRVLSDHMHNLHSRKLYPDMTISSNPRLRLGGYVIEDRIHKGIFAARAYGWWEGFTNARRVDDIPDDAICTLRGSTLPIVLDYMYTGKVFNFSACDFQEVEAFAKLTTFGSLLSLLERIRSR